MRVCSVHGCPEIYAREQGSRCLRHRAIADRARGTSTERGYNSAGHAEFRRLVLLKHPICGGCGIRLSTVADHHPHDRRELIELGLDPNDPKHGRGLCDECHGKATAANQPGGWHTPCT